MPLTLLPGGLTTQTSNYSILSNDGTVNFDATSGSVTGTLPTAVGISGKTITIKKIDSSANTVFIAFTGGQNADGRTGNAITLRTQYEFFTLQSNGANWIIVATNETVAFAYGNSSAQSYTTGTIVTVANWTKDYDTHSMMNATTGVATIVVPGKYIFTAHIEFAVSATGGRGCFLLTTGSNGRQMGTSQIAGISTDTCIIPAGEVVILAAGDTVACQAFQRSGGNLSLSASANDNRFCLTKVGN